MLNEIYKSFLALTKRTNALSVNVSNEIIIKIHLAKDCVNE